VLRYLLGEVSAQTRYELRGFYTLEKKMSNFINYMQDNFLKITMFAVGRTKKAQAHPDSRWHHENLHLASNDLSSYLINRGESIVSQPISIR
jgi:hypothetical protein